MGSEQRPSRSHIEATLATGLCIALVFAAKAQAVELPDAAGAQLKESCELARSRLHVGSEHLVYLSN